jgi:hypothetical protein
LEERDAGWIKWLRPVEVVGLWLGWLPDGTGGCKLTGAPEVGITKNPRVRRVNSFTVIGVARGYSCFSVVLDISATGFRGCDLSLGFRVRSRALGFSLCSGFSDRSEP